MNQTEKPPKSFVITPNGISWKYSSAEKPKGNAFRVAMVGLGVAIICFVGGTLAQAHDPIRSSMLFGISCLGVLIMILQLWQYSNRVKISWRISFEETSLVLKHQLPKGERVIKTPYQQIEKIHLRFFSIKQKVVGKEHWTEVSAWGRGNYYSPVIETPRQVINLMELGRKEDQQWLVHYLEQKISERLPNKFG